MYEIHFHLLFGLDDGPQTLEMSLALAEASIQEGVTHIVATPHANHRWTFNPEVNRERLAELNTYLAGRVTLGLGCDFHLSYENIENLRLDPSKYTINGKQYLLVEFSDTAIPPTIGTTFYEMQTQGTIPIITHPERNQILAPNPTRMAEWISAGCLVQVTAASITGRFGRRAQSVAQDLLQRNWVHVIASDAHSIDGRPPSLSEAHAWIKNNHGAETADRLCIENPRAIFHGEALGPQPEPLHIEDSSKPGKGLLDRLLGR